MYFFNQIFAKTLNLKIIPNNNFVIYVSSIIIRQEIYLFNELIFG